MFRKLIDRITGRTAERERQVAEYLDAQRRFDEFTRAWGFRHAAWSWQECRDHEEVLVVRQEWDDPHVMRPADCWPGMNIWGLYWRPLPSKQLH